jgi:hypothetical protein
MQESIFISLFDGTNSKTFSQFIMSYLTVDASQLVVSNGNYLDSLHSLQVKSILCTDVCEAI